MKFVLTQETAQRSDKMIQSAIMPRWAQIGLLVSVVMSSLMNVLKLAINGSGAVLLKVAPFLVLIVGFSIFRAIQQRRKKAAGMAANVGKELSVSFFENRFELVGLGKHLNVGYENIRRIGRDENGLVLIMPRVGGLWIPLSAFVSSDERDKIFTMIGGNLRKGRQT